MRSETSAGLRWEGGTPVQLFGLTYQMPTAMTNRTTPTLMITRTALVVALSRMPMTSTAVARAMMMTAGRLNQAPSTEEKVSLDRNSGTIHRGPKKTLRKTLKYLVQSDASTAQLMAYSRTRAQPVLALHLLQERFQRLLGEQLLTEHEGPSSRRPRAGAPVPLTPRCRPRASRPARRRGC